MLRLCCFFPQISASNTYWQASVHQFDQLPVNSSDFRGSQYCFFTKCKHIATPSFLRFVSFPIPFLCIATFSRFSVTITGTNGPYLCLSSPNPTLVCLATFFCFLLLLRVFSSCDERDCLLIFPTVIKRTFVKTSSVFQVSHQPCPKILVAVRTVSIWSN